MAKSCLSFVLRVNPRSAEEFHAPLCPCGAFRRSGRGRAPASLVIEGRAFFDGTRNIHFGENVLLYPALHLETSRKARIDIGDGVVISRGVHIVAMAGVTIGAGSMIGEYASIRDANHQRSEEQRASANRATRRGPIYREGSVDRARGHCAWRGNHWRRGNRRRERCGYTGCCAGHYGGRGTGSCDRAARDHNFLILRFLMAIHSPQPWLKGARARKR